MSRIESETLILNGGGQNKREIWADIARGIGVILVILGHTSQLPSIFIEWIYSFHMPLFFWISGYFFRGTPNIAVYVKKKAKALLRPYILYSLVFLGINYFILREDGNLISNEIIGGLSGQGTDGILWFFLALFWTEILFVFLRKNLQKALPIAIIGCVVCATIFSGETNYQSGVMKIPSAMFAIGFYYCGYVTQRYNFINWVKRVPLLVYLAFHLVLLVIFHPGLSLNTASTSNLLIAYMIAVIGICGVVKFTDIFWSKWSVHIGRILAYIGKNSLYYYPITGYVPVALVKFIVLLGGEKNVIVVFASKGMGFLMATVVCFLQKSIQLSRQNKEKK